MLREIFHDPELAVAIAFVIAIVVVSKKVWQSLAGLLDERAAKIKAELDEAQKLKDDAQKTLGQFQRRQRDALQEAEAIVAHAREDAVRFAERAKRDLAAVIERRQRLAQEKIALAEAKALAEVRNTAVDVAIGAARQVIAERLLAGAQGQVLVDQAIAELPQRLN
ncbi:MAG TPA: F0F1 ATP synthase subunit B [Stellaceae bacterium]|nr:F0F1 ATP synthase subunit B [Stellaceae bacterium]